MTKSKVGMSCQRGKNLLTSSAIYWVFLATVFMCVCFSQGSANAINDVNNMLRDSSKNSNNNNNGEEDVSDVGNFESAEMLRFVDDNQGNAEKPSNQNTEMVGNATNTANTATGATASVDDNETMLPLHDQVRLLSKQLNALMMRRREDYALLERNLRKSLMISAAATTKTSSSSSNAVNGATAGGGGGGTAGSFDVDVRIELEQLRHELKILRDGHPLVGNKEKLTIDWLTQSIAEIRKQLVELQQIASDANSDISRRSQSFEDVATMRSDFRQLKLELAAMRERQERVEVYVQELREEVQQQEGDFKRLLHNHNRHNHYYNHHNKKLKQQNLNKQTEDGDGDVDVESVDGERDEGRKKDNEFSGETQEDASNDIELSTVPLADHRRRHSRFQRQQIHELQLAQSDLKRQLNELKYHRIGERVRSIEIEQHRIADANFNLSRQIASLDKLHSSMLELLEDVEGLQNKVDKSVPELRHEISKLEFAQAQLNSEQSLLREEGQNVARSVQAMAVSVSALQEERDGVRAMQSVVQQLQADVKQVQSHVDDTQRSVATMMEQQKLKQQQSREKQQQQQPSRAEKLEAVTVATDDQSVHASQMNQHHLQQQQEHQQQQPQHHQQQHHHRSHHQQQQHQQQLSAENLVSKLENVELQYESLINNLPHDCSDIESSANDANGLNLIAPAGQHRPIMAHCAPDGWTTVQRRYDGSADFNRSWEDYAAGFGSPSGEYWIGNEQLHALTQNNCTSLRIRMQDIYDNAWVAEYVQFHVSSRDDGYRLHISGYAGNASDALDYQQGMQFSAVDVDRDISQTHCAANYEGGWWFSHCQHANLNGRYNLGLTWFDASRNEWIAVKSSQMLIKRLPAAACAAAIAATANEASESSSSVTTVATATVTTQTETHRATPTATSTWSLATARSTAMAGSVVVVDVAGTR